MDPMWWYCSTVYPLPYIKYHYSALVGNYQLTTSPLRAQCTKIISCEGNPISGRKISSLSKKKKQWNCMRFPKPAIWTHARFKYKDCIWATIGIDQFSCVTHLCSWTKVLNHFYTRDHCHQLIPFMGNHYTLVRCLLIVYYSIGCGAILAWPN